MGFITLGKNEGRVNSAIGKGKLYIRLENQLDTQMGFMTLRKNEGGVNNTTLEKIGLRCGWVYNPRQK